jgi:hypothetical protein
MYGVRMRYLILQPISPDSIGMLEDLCQLSTADRALL